MENKYQKTIDRIQKGGVSRADLLSMQRKAELAVKKGDHDAQDIVNAIGLADPDDDYVVFMGFCPDANISNRLDVEWRQKGICEFGFLESEHQVEQFDSILKGDLIVLK